MNSVTHCLFPASPCYIINCLCVSRRGTSTMQSGVAMINMDAISLRKTVEAANDTPSPRWMNRLLGVFGVIALEAEGMTLARLSISLGAPKSSLLTLLRPLVAQGYLTHKDGRYGLGPEIYGLAATIIASRKFSNLMRPIMEQLMAASGETVIIATLERAAGMILYQDVIESVQAIRYVVPAGELRSLHASAGGRVMLAFQDESWRESYLANAELKPLTDATITDADTLRDILSEIRLTGLSVSMGQAVVGAAGFAAPIFDQDGTIFATMIIGAPEMRAKVERDKLSRLVIEAAAKASRALGYNDPLRNNPPSPSGKTVKPEAGAAPFAATPANIKPPSI
ncbi:IclR family transcriptional regulator [Oryzicola mucosus]|uniref:IclR family transcriptional regulator n=1 Tax=Oryzicola mucosus TaxID=2767425 RepID=A0A8J6PNG5_9HYPH|nr:IclR family transcriptional regulator [Oryzicola mucosus]MBD0416721.1 IclR family transcriptional regulator [Oryzicola mucosus]